MVQFHDQLNPPNHLVTWLHPRIDLPPTQAISNYSTRLMCAGIILLNFLGFHTGCVQTSFEKSYPEPLVNQGSLPPEEADGPFQSWKDRQKYFLVVAVNETGLPNTDLPFTQADATEIATALTKLGYQPLDSDHPILTGKEATRSAIIKSVKSSDQGKSDNDIIVIYFTGHGSVGTKDLWLQTFGQEELGEGQGIALSELITRARFKEGKAAFEGELVIIVDTCFSGQGVLSQSLTMGELGRKTTIFSASTKKQESYLLKGPDL